MNLQKKVENSRITEKEYRKLPAINYSALKCYMSSKKKFHKEYILQDTSEREESASTIMGSIVHAMLCSQEEFDSKFHISTAPEVTGQMAELVEALYSRTLKSLNEEGVQTETFEQIFMDAVNTVKYDYDMKEVKFKGKNLEKIVEMFSGSNAEILYKEKITTIGKTVVSVSMLQQAEKIVEKVRSHPYTRDIVNMQSNEHVEVFNEIPVTFQIDGVEFKSLIDKLVVDHINKIVTPWDYKTSWDSTNLEYSYLKNGYWLQVALYYVAITEWMKEHLEEDYMISPLKYISIDTQGWEDPIVYECSMTDVNAGWDGFRINGRKYQGAEEIIKAIHWHEENGTWSTTKELQESNGIAKLSIQYQ